MTPLSQPSKRLTWYAMGTADTLPHNSRNRLTHSFEEELALRETKISELSALGIVLVGGTQRAKLAICLHLYAHSPG